LVTTNYIHITNAKIINNNKHDVERKQFIKEINLYKNLSWKAGFNSRFKDKPIGYSKKLCGVLNDDNEKIKDLLRQGVLQYSNVEIAEKLPKQFDSESNWPMCSKVIGDIRDQSDCGCCWAFGPASAASDRLCIATKGEIQVALSSEEACFCPDTFQGDCDGGYSSDPWLHVSDTGIVTGGQFNNSGPFAKEGFCSSFSLPHCHHHGPQRGDPYPKEGTKGCPEVDESPKCPNKCDSGSKTGYNNWKKDRYKIKEKLIQVFKTDPDQIASSIMKHGSVSATFTVYPDFENYVSGIYHLSNNQSQPLGGHAVRIVGFGEDENTGEKYWKVANSWNKYWGEKGYFRIRRGTDECDIESNVLSSHDKATWSGPGIEN